MSILGQPAGGFGYPKTFIITDENGNELTAVLTDSVKVFDATANDIRLGKLAATDNGITEGTKEIPAYHTQFGTKLVKDGEEFLLYITNYDYTKLQAIFCPFNTILEDSVAADRVVIDDRVYPVGVTASDGAIAVNHELERIEFGITNNSGKDCVIRYFTCKEIY